MTERNYHCSKLQYIIEPFNLLSNMIAVYTVIPMIVTYTHLALNGIRTCCDTGCCTCKQHVHHFHVHKCTWAMSVFN